jgi:hypothetical protein
MMDVLGDGLSDGDDYNQELTGFPIKGKIMAISFEIRKKKVQELGKIFDKNEIPFEFTDTNEIRVYLSPLRKHWLDVAFEKRDEFYQLKARHDLTKEEVRQLNRIMLIVVEVFET